MAMRRTNAVQAGGTAVGVVAASPAWTATAAAQPVAEPLGPRQAPASVTELPALDASRPSEATAPANAGVDPLVPTGVTLMAVGTALTIAGGVTLADASSTSCQTTGLSSAPSGQSLVWQRCFEERVESEEGKGIAMLGLGPGPVLVGGLTLMASGLDADRHDRKNEAAAVAGMAITALGASGLGLGGGLIGWNIGDNMIGLTSSNRRILSRSRLFEREHDVARSIRATA